MADTFIERALRMALEIAETAADTKTKLKATELAVQLLTQRKTRQRKGLKGLGELLGRISEKTELPDTKNSMRDTKKRRSRGYVGLAEGPDEPNTMEYCDPAQENKAP